MKPLKSLILSIVISFALLHSSCVKEELTLSNNDEFIKVTLLSEDAANNQVTHASLSVSANTASCGYPSCKGKGEEMKRIYQQKANELGEIISVEFYCCDQNGNTLAYLLILYPETLTSKEVKISSLEN